MPNKSDWSFTLSLLWIQSIQCHRIHYLELLLLWPFRLFVWCRVGNDQSWDAGFFQGLLHWSWAGRRWERTERTLGSRDLAFHWLLWSGCRASSVCSGQRRWCPSCPELFFRWLNYTFLENGFKEISFVWWKKPTDWFLLFFVYFKFGFNEGFLKNFPSFVFNVSLRFYTICIYFITMVSFVILYFSEI